MPRRRSVRMYSFSYRRRNPSMFPEVCTICTPEKRFRLPDHKAQNDNDINSGLPGIYAGSTYASTSFSKYCRSSNTWITRPVSVSPCKLYGLTRFDLETFVHDEIEPDTAYNNSCKAIVNRLCQFMKNNFPDELLPAKIIKGTAVKGRSDADLVLFLSHAKYSSIADIKYNMKEILAKMTQYLKYGDCDFQGTTLLAVKVSVSCHLGHTHDVDILPRLDILKQGI